MNFIEAIKLARQGKIMGYKTVEDDYITYLSTHGEYSSTNEHLVKVDTTKLEEVYIEDILRDNWEEVEPKDEKLHTFEEAIVAYKSGKTIKRASCYNYHNPSDKQFIVTTASLLANDWVILERE